ncbi:YciI family protein, partial [Phaeobacter sp. JH18-12]
RQCPQLRNHHSQLVIVPGYFGPTPSQVNVVNYKNNERERMVRWVVIFKDSIEMLEVRARKDLRDAHVAYAKDHPELLIGGGLKPEEDEPFCGALWVVEATTKAEVKKLVENDPFYFPKHRSFEIFTWGKLLEDQTATL